LEGHPGNAGLVFTAAEIFHNLGYYESAIANYLNIIKAIESTEGEVPVEIHNDLVDAYYRLGQKHSFSKELCLRIIYHAEKCFEENPGLANDENLINFLRSMVGHYDVASMDTNVKMMEHGGDGLEFELPDDGINLDEKITFENKAVERIKEFDLNNKKNSFSLEPSDKTIDDLINLVDQQASAIKSIHFKRVNVFNDANLLLEEVFYKGPDKIKVIESNAISVINNNYYYVINSETNQIADEQPIDPAKFSLLRGIGIFNFREDKQSSNLTVEKISSCPDFLNEACNQSFFNLYLVTVRPKDDDSYSPISKIEYFVDANTGLSLAKREYWIGTLGSGKQEELAKETIITKIEQNSDGILLPHSGWTKGYVNELSDLNEQWVIDILEINEQIKDEVFNVFK